MAIERTSVATPTTVPPIQVAKNREQQVRLIKDALFKAHPGTEGSSKRLFGPEEFFNTTINDLLEGGMTPQNVFDNLDKIVGSLSKSTGSDEMAMLLVGKSFGRLVTKMLASKHYDAEKVSTTLSKLDSLVSLQLSKNGCMFGEPPLNFTSDEVRNWLSNTIMDQISSGDIVLAKGKDIVPQVIMGYEQYSQLLGIRGSGEVKAVNYNKIWGTQTGKPSKADRRTYEDWLTFTRDRVLVVCRVMADNPARKMIAIGNADHLRLVDDVTMGVDFRAKVFELSWGNIDKDLAKRLPGIKDAKDRDGLTAALDLMKKAALEARGSEALKKALDEIVGRSAVKGKDALAELKALAEKFKDADRIVATGDVEALLGGRDKKGFNFMEGFEQSTLVKFLSFAHRTIIENKVRVATSAGLKLDPESLKLGADDVPFLYEAAAGASAESDLTFEGGGESFKTRILLEGGSESDLDIPAENTTQVRAYGQGVVDEVAYGDGNGHLKWSLGPYGDARSYINWVKKTPEKALKAEIEATAVKTPAPREVAVPKPKP